MKAEEKGTQRQSYVRSEVDMLERVIEDLKTSTNVLQERLVSVLRQDGTTPEAQLKTGLEYENVELSKTLHSYIESISTVVSQINSIVDRCEL